MRSQLSFLPSGSRAFGGDLMKTRRGRRGSRPLDTRQTMHVVLRSSKARGDWSFRRPQNREQVERILARFSARYGVRIHSFANVGNHLHLHLKLSNRQLYRPFIRAVTGAIAMAVTGATRWNRPIGKERVKFWDYRPFTRVIASGRRALLAIRDYLELNRWEGAGYTREEARWIVRLPRGAPDTS